VQQGSYNNPKSITTSTGINLIGRKQQENAETGTAIH
jgi:hypothetical protein